MQWTKPRQLQTVIATMALIALSGSLVGCDNCPNLSESECKDTKGCSAKFGQNKEGERKYAGCIESGRPESPAITCAEPGEAAGECLRFSTTKIPDGWKVAPCDGVRCPDP